MRTFRPKRGSFVEAPYFTEEELEGIALDELSQYNLLPAAPNPIRIERFVEKRFRVSVESADLGEGILGLTIFGPDGVQHIYVSQDLDADESVASERRTRSTIAHEAGHGLLHAHLFAAVSGVPLFGDVSDPRAPKVMCREGSADGERKHYGGEWWEYQANAIMGRLLMPRPLVASAVTPFLTTSGALGGMRISPDQYEAAVRDLAEIFNVNPILSRIRLEGLFPGKEDGQLML